MRLTNEELQERIEAVAKHGTQRKAAEALGISQSTLNESLKTASERGMNGRNPVLEGFRLERTTTVFDGDGNKQREFITQKRGELAPEAYELPANQQIERMSTLLDAEGRKVLQWVKSKDSTAPEDVAALLKRSFDDVPALPAIPRPDASDENTMTLYPLADLHLGLSAWGKETGTNWDLKIAEASISAAIEDVIRRSPDSKTGIVLGGGDLLHSDNNENKTAKSGNVLQVDGRYQKVLMSANRLLVRTVELALKKHEDVIVRILPGNHDEHSSVAVAYYLLAWFRDNPRVTVDIDPGLFFWYRFGKTFIGATHGHTVKLGNMAGIMAHRRAEDWGASLYRYIHGFHIHHKSQIATEGYGVIAESHQTPTPQDAWHFGSGFLSGRSMQSITYHMLYGEISRVRVAMIDS